LRSGWWRSCADRFPHRRECSRASDSFDHVTGFRRDDVDLGAGGATTPPVTPAPVDNLPGPTAEVGACVGLNIGECLRATRLTGAGGYVRPRRVRRDAEAELPCGVYDDGVDIRQDDAAPRRDASRCRP